MIKKINLRGISEILSEKELKNVMGGSGSYMCYCKGSYVPVSGPDIVYAVVQNNIRCGNNGGGCYSA